MRPRVGGVDNTCEVEYGGRGDDDGEAVRNDWVIRVIIRGIIPPHHAGDRVGEAVAQMDPGIAEAHACGTEEMD